MAYPPRSAQGRRWGAATIHFVTFPEQPRQGPALVTEGAFLALPWCWASARRVAWQIGRAVPTDPDTMRPAGGLWDRPTTEVGRTTQQLLTDTVMTLQIHSNAFWRILEWDADGRPAVILPLHPDQVWLRERWETGLRDYWVAGEGRPITGWEIIHFQGPSLLGTERGISLIEAQARSIAISTHEAEVAKVVMQDGAIPQGGYLSTGDRLSPEQRAENAEAWYRAKGGRQEDVAVMDGGLGWQHPGLKPEDLELVASRRLSAAEQCAIVGVPPHLVGAPVDTESETYSNVQQDLEIFRRLTLEPWISALTASLHVYGVDVALPVDALIMPSFGDLVTALASAVAAGIITVDEARTRWLALEAMTATQPETPPPEGDTPPPDDPMPTPAPGDD